MGSLDTGGSEADGRVVVRRGRLSEVLALIETAGAGGLVVRPAGSATASTSEPSAEPAPEPAPGSPAGSAPEGGHKALPASGVYWLALRGGVPVGYAAGRLDARGCTPVRHAARPGPGHQATLDALQPVMADWAELAGIPLVEVT